MTILDVTSSPTAANVGRRRAAPTDGDVAAMERRQASWASSLAVRRVMRGNRKRDTQPEMALRRAAHAAGLRYRVAARPLVGHPWTADLVFTKARLAVFVDGCYWHGCPVHFKPPQTNAGYWGPKIARNRSRDQLVDRTLASEGWASLRIWEHEPPDVALRRVLLALRAERC